MIEKTVNAGTLRYTVSQSHGITRITAYSIGDLCAPMASMYISQEALPDFLGAIFDVQEDAASREARD